MSLSDLTNIGGFVSSLAVLVSLVYLALQIRQSAKNQKAAIHNERNGHLLGLLAGSYADKQTKDVCVRGLNADTTLSPVECNQFEHVQLCFLNFCQEYFLMFRDGMIGKERYTHTMNNLKMDVTRPGTRATWKTIRGGFDPAFAAHVDGFVRETSPVDNGDNFATPFLHFAKLERAALAVPPGE